MARVRRDIRQQRRSTSCWLLPSLIASGLTCGIAAPCRASLYMLQEHGFLTYVRVNNLAGKRRGNSVRGEFQMVSADDRAENGVTVNRASVSGSQTGSGLLLETDGLFGLGTKQLYGTLNGGRLSLNFPTDTGRIEKLVFHVASEDQWNRALSAFSRRRAAEVAALRRRQARAAAIQDLQGRIHAARADEAQAEQDLAVMEKQTPTGKQACDQAQAELNVAHHRLEQAKKQQGIAQKRLEAARAVSQKADEVARECGSARNLEAVQHAQHVVEDVAAQIKGAAGDIQQAASEISANKGPADPDLRGPQSRIDAARSELDAEAAGLSAPTGERPDEGTQTRIETAAGQVEFAAGQVEAAVGGVEFALGQVEAAIGSVEFDVSRTEARLSYAQGRVAADQQAEENRRGRIAGDQKAIEQGERQLDALDPSWRGQALLSQYAAAVRWFNPHLSETAARRLAAAVARCAYRRGLDARLLLAVMAAEGSPDKTQNGHGLVGGYPLEAATDALAVDLQQRLKHTAGPDIRQPTWEQIKGALTQRYQSDQGATGEQASRYVRKVAHFYYPMCGLKSPED